MVGIERITSSLRRFVSMLVFLPLNIKPICPTLLAAKKFKVHPYRHKDLSHRLPSIQCRYHTNRYRYTGDKGSKNLITALRIAIRIL